MELYHARPNVNVDFMRCFAAAHHGMFWNIRMLKICLPAGGGCIRQVRGPVLHDAGLTLVLKGRSRVFRHGKRGN